MKIVTFNIDWARSNPKEAVSIRSVTDDADILLFQEAKHIEISKVLNDDWQVHQSISDHAKQGVAVAWQRTTASRHRGPGRFGSGYKIGVMPLGLKMLPRYINWRDLKVDGKVIRFISTHRPPQRFRRLWPIFDRALARFVRRSPHPVIVGMDSNERDHRGLSRLTGLDWHGIGIDGFLVSRSLHVKNIKSLPKANSDHHPISIEI